MVFCMVEPFHYPAVRVARRTAASASTCHPISILDRSDTRLRTGATRREVRWGQELWKAVPGGAAVARTTTGAGVAGIVYAT